jgi:hypothetical protein
MATPSIRAALLLGLLDVAACGGDQASPDAAAPPPGSADAHEAADGPSAGTIDVTVYANGRPVAGADVVVGDPSGAVVAHAVTASDGSLQALAPAGGSVTVALREGTLHQLFVISGVMPGDRLRVGEPDQPHAVVGRVRVSVPAFAGADGYWVQACERRSVAAPTTVDIDVEKRCVVGGRIPVLVAASMAGTTRAYALKADVSVAAGQVTNVSLPAWRTDLGTLALTLTAAPSTTAAYANASRIVDGDTVISPDWMVSRGLTSGQTATFALPLIDGLGTGTYYGASLTLAPTAADSNVSAVFVRTTQMPVAATIDMGALGLGSISGVMLDRADIARPVIRWTTTVGGTAAAVAYAALQWDAAGGGFFDHQLIAMAPPSSSSFRMPALPDELQDFRPAGVFAKPSVSLEERSDLADYDASRNGIALGSELNPTGVGELTWRSLTYLAQE